MPTLLNFRGCIALATRVNQIVQQEVHKSPPSCARCATAWQAPPPVALLHRNLAKMVAKQPGPPIDLNTMTDLFLQVCRSHLLDPAAKRPDTCRGSTSISADAVLIGKSTQSCLSNLRSLVSEKVCQVR